MDPNATLAQIRLYAALISAVDLEDVNALDAYELVEAVNALDEWLTKGGFLPSDWSNR